MSGSWIRVGTIITPPMPVIGVNREGCKCSGIRKEKVREKAKEQKEERARESKWRSGARRKERDKTGVCGFIVKTQLEK